VTRTPKSLAALFAWLVFLSAAAGATDKVAHPADALRQASGSIESLVRRVSPSVVQVVVTGYRPVEREPGRTDTAFSRGRSIGSGVVIADGGYIVTNAHVVAGAERIDVIVSDNRGDDRRLRPASTGARIVQARLMGIAPEIDLALLAVDVPGLPALAIADSDTLRQGELVFAFGSPDGLQNSVTMGMISAVARQTEPDSPVVYIQTDAAINPGNSGGALVNVDGALVGINTFIRSASGGSEGLGFALPSAFVALAFPHLRDFGHLHRGLIGLSVQTVTPLLAEGLGLPGVSGLIASEVAPGSPADAAGLRAGDVMTAIDGLHVDDVPIERLYLHLLSLAARHHVRIEAQRGQRAFTVTATAIEQPHVCERPSLVDAQATLVEALGILGVPVGDGDSVGAGDLPRRTGVVVAMRIDTPHAPDVLAQGDIIHAVNGAPVADVETLRSAVERIARHAAVVLQVSRNGRLSYVALERE
jgi:serine protease Do